MRKLSLGYSPCPNDTFVFYGLTRGAIDTGDISFKETLADVETLNSACLDSTLDISKVSFFALGAIGRNYGLLRSGAALGRGCGPLIVAKEGISKERLLKTKIAVPGVRTTANLLLQLYAGREIEVAAMPFETIMPRIKEGLFDAGVIIHEGRFTYPGYGLVEIADLGRWWEEESGLPIPLGGIVMKRSLGAALAGEVERLIRRSAAFAGENPDTPMDYVRAHAQEMDEAVIADHIDLYVNDYTLDLGEEGLEAVEGLMAAARKRGLMEESDLPLLAAQ